MATTNGDHFTVARRHMVDSQLRPNKVTNDRLAQAMEQVPRELFVPKSLRGVAYLDEDIEIADGRHLMEPMVLARLLQAADVRGDDIVLDVACGSGYSTAVIARLAGTVVGVESDVALAERATALLTDLEVDNAAVVEGAFDAGLPDQGPYDVILLNGAVPAPPPALLDQLADGGRLVAVIRGDRPTGQAIRFSRHGDGVTRKVLFDATCPPLPGFAAPAGFVF